MLSMTNRAAKKFPLARPSASSETTERTPFVWPRVAAVVAAVAVVVLPVFASRLVGASEKATTAVSAAKAPSLATDGGEFPLMDIRVIELETAEADQEADQGADQSDG